MLQNGGDDQVHQFRFDPGARDELGQSRVDGGHVVTGLFDMAVEQAMLAAVVGLLRDEGANRFGQVGRGAFAMRAQGSMKKASPRGKVEERTLCQAVATGLLPNHQCLISEFRKNRASRTFIAPMAPNFPLSWAGGVTRRAAIRWVALVMI
jgi:hypothetical protein